MEGAPAKAFKQQIDTEWIYPPVGDRATVLVAADPRRVVVASQAIVWLARLVDPVLINQDLQKIKEL